MNAAFWYHTHNSSVQIQKELGLNQDTTLNPSKSEGQKLRE